MDQSSSLADKRTFLHKYESLPKVIKANSSCYAISNEWWANFECLVSIANMEPDTLMGHPGPINNLPLLDLHNVYKDLVLSKYEDDYASSPDALVLAEMNDWDNMSLKPDLKYKTDFVVVSSFIWRFLQERFGGGPEIELLPETKTGNTSNLSPKIISSESESFLDKNLVVNLDLIKVYVAKDSDFASAIAKYVSPTLTVNNLLNCLCKDYYIPIHKASLLHSTKQSGLVELEDKKATLASLNVRNGSFLTITRAMESLLGYPSVSKNEAAAGRSRNRQREREEEMENSNEEGGGRRQRHQFDQDSDFGINCSTNSRDSTDSARLSTGSTNPHLNPLDFSEYMLGDDVSGMNAQNMKQETIELKDFRNDGINLHGNKPEIPDLKDQNHPNLETFLKRSKQSTDKHKIKLEFKSLQEIKRNLINIQREWNLWTNANLNKKA